jgi:hypothetical protein
VDLQVANDVIILQHDHKVLLKQCCDFVEEHREHLLGLDLEVVKQRKGGLTKAGESVSQPFGKVAEEYLGVVVGGV